MAVRQGVDGVAPEYIRGFAVSYLGGENMALVERQRIVMVLSDGETYTGLSGCSIVQVPDEIDESEVDEFVKDAVSEQTPSVLTTFR